MKDEIFMVKHDGRHYGPFLSYEIRSFTSTLTGDFEVVPLLSPLLPDEKKGPLQLQTMDTDEYRAHVDSYKVDTDHTLAAITQQLCFARRDERVLTAREILDLWKHLFRVDRAVESLMHYAEKVVADPSPSNLEALRKAFWRNRDSDDFDPHYADRFG